jgi:hypothetical protein
MWEGELDSSGPLQGLIWGICDHIIEILVPTKEGHILQPAERLQTSEACLCSMGLINITIYSTKQIMEASKKIRQGKHTWSSWKCLIFLSSFSHISICYTYFNKSLQYTNFMEIHPVGANLFNSDGRMWQS